MIAHCKIWTCFLAGAAIDKKVLLNPLPESTAGDHYRKQ
jgi:hypothetical protein